MKSPDQIRIFSAICRELHKQGFRDVDLETANKILAAANLVVAAFSPKDKAEGRDA